MPYEASALADAAGYWAMQNLFSATRIRCLCLVLMVAGSVVFAEETPVANDVEKQNIEAALKLGH